MQDSLFPEPEGPAPITSRLRARAAKVGAAEPDESLIALARSLPAHLRLGTSSWAFPGWVGTVWDAEYPDAKLSKHGLSAYAKHPLFRTVSLDRGFYRPLTVAQFEAYAAQVPDDFRFIVKSPSLVTDAMLRDESGRGHAPNGAFLDPVTALRVFIEPALEGLGRKLGALVFQISPLPRPRLVDIAELIARLHALLRAIPDLRGTAPDGAIAVEVRDAAWLTPGFTQALGDTGSTYCMGLHAKMPRIADQLPILRALWPGPLVCRWNLNPLYGAFGYEKAREEYAPFDRLVDPDVDIRTALAKVIAGTVGAGQNAFVALNNKAEGSAPLSVVALAQAIRAQHCGN